MNKKLSCFALLAAVLAFGPAVAETNSGVYGASSADLTSAPATRTRENVNYKKYQTRTTTRTYKQADGGDLYYTQPTKRSDLYKQYNAANSSSAKATKTTVRTTRSEKIVDKLKRKYYLAHPFFQPLGGNFGSITDLSYNRNTFDFDLPFTFNGNSVSGGDWAAKTFSIKEDFSYGITDTLALVAMARFDAADYAFTYQLDGVDVAESKMENSDLNTFGIGGQWRIVDNEKWIATVMPYYQRQKDFANTFALDLKAGYKVARSTIYGLARAWYLKLDESSYGTFVDNSAEVFYIAFDTDVKNLFYFEGGLGVFSVLNQDWTLNVEGVYGAYDWHNQMSVKAALGWQPNDWFALNIYAKASIYDSADNKTLGGYLYTPSVGLDQLSYIGAAKMDNAQDMSLGAQIIFHF